MHLNDMFAKHGIPPTEVLVFRHRPRESGLRKSLPWLAAENPAVYNAYQQSQTLKVEGALMRAKYVASFIGTDAGTGLFAGLYAVQGWRSVNSKEYFQIAANRHLHESFGIGGPTADRPVIRWFDLALSAEFYSSWRGRLVIRWPGLERSWWRWADRNAFEIESVHQASIFETAMPAWDELVVTWPELKELPSKWRAALKEWRGIYYILDSSDGRGYVGSACGVNNILGRWVEYGISGHGGNKELRKRNPVYFRFSILQRVSPDMPAEDVVRSEQAWKTRLHTREFGLNEN